jgi:hypothetical protein
MQLTQSLDWIESLTYLGFLWGPFFFSILYILVVPRIAHAYYAAVTVRNSPPALPEEIQEYRTYFRWSVRTGLILVALSVAWWLYAQFQYHIYKGIISGLEKDQVIAIKDDDMYYRTVQWDSGGGHIISAYKFVIVSNQPFVNSRLFDLSFYPESGVIGDNKPEPIKLTLEARRGENKYVIERDGDSYRVKLER